MPERKHVKGDDAKAEEFKRKLEEYEQAQQIVGKVFDPEELFREAQEFKAVLDAELGLVRFGCLTFQDSFAIAKCENAEEKVQAIVWLMLQKAHPTLTLNRVKQMPLHKAHRLLGIISRESSFLSGRASPSKNGSETTGKPRKPA